MNRRGATLLEVLLFSTISVGILLWVTPWLSTPGRLEKKLQATFDERKVLRATDLLLNDVKQIIPGSFQLAEGDGSSVRFQVVGEFQSEQVAYEFQRQPGHTEGDLFRVVEGTATIVLSRLLPPEVDRPIFAYDSKLRLLVLDIRMKQPSGPPLRAVRYAALPN